MRQFSLIFIFMITAVQVSLAQQDAQVSLYLRNPLQINPAHAGLDGTLRTTSIARMQWTGWTGAPRTQWFSSHAPIFRNRMGIGLTVINDASGARSQQDFKLNAAYHLPELNYGIKVSAGMGLGLVSDSFDFQDLQVRHEDDAIVPMPFQAVRPSASMGVLVSYDAWFTSLSIPRLFETNLGTVDPMGRKKRHGYWTMGYVHSLNAIMDIRAVTLVKWMSKSPAIMDMNVECWLYDVLSVGAMVRWAEGMGFQASYRFKEGFRAHYAVDFPLNGLMNRSFGSHEIGLSWDYGTRNVAYRSPRYF